ncbi:hypothetical protein SALBM135S_06519 [Streptomyces alboniger]
MPLALPHTAVGAVARRDDGVLRLHSADVDVPLAELRVDELTPLSDGPAALIRGETVRVRRPARGSSHRAAAAERPRRPLVPASYPYRPFPDGVPRSSGSVGKGVSVVRIRVLVVDDHRIFAESLAAALAAEPDVDVSAAAAVPPLCAAWSGRSPKGAGTTYCSSTPTSAPPRAPSRAAGPPSRSRRATPTGSSTASPWSRGSARASPPSATIVLAEKDDPRRAALALQAGASGLGRQGLLPLTPAHRHPRCAARRAPTCRPRCSPGSCAS